MNENLNTLLDSLDEEIERKCFEMKEKQREKNMKRTFMLCCLLFIIVPVTLVFLGMSALTFITWAAIFMVVSAVVLSPVVFKSNLEVFYNEKI